MSQNQLEIRGFKVVFVILGVVYMMMASYALIAGTEFLCEFGVPKSVYAEPVFTDIFMFYYQLMWIVGLFTLLFGLVTRGLSAQRLIASAMCATHLFISWRDLSTSDSRFGNHLYHGEKTLVFVYIGLAIALAFGVVALLGFLPMRSEQTSKTPTAAG